jgi:hypothetical protein
MNELPHEKLQRKILTLKNPIESNTHEQPTKPIKKLHRLFDVPCTLDNFINFFIKDRAMTVKKRSDFGHAIAAIARSRGMVLNKKKVGKMRVNLYPFKFLKYAYRQVERELKCQNTPD